jgi:NAD(P)-dependent dehydrogenase (short-subunit alcohol dehydrogenase family)
MYGTRQLTKDGIELTWAVNHLAPFLLSKLLLQRLKERARRPASSPRYPRGIREHTPSCAAKQNRLPRCNGPPSEGPRERRRDFNFAISQDFRG